ncbi:hypothetical protein UFOVP724_140 [uncultured Caudovirales phage]|uniref:Uncharacterized protein n=1 Tax=uncultured Caudovirales phage TaxID=2100421 RepID=A0A6J5NN26_9CAUD|nr:hypothetical protein UFOVP724_140 [uncultured Caudovirales phage]
MIYKDTAFTQNSKKIISLQIDLEKVNKELTDLRLSHDKLSVELEERIAEVKALRKAISLMEEAKVTEEVPPVEEVLAEPTMELQEVSDEQDLLLDEAKPKRGRSKKQ